MSPSPRKPRVPRVASPSGPSRRSGGELDEVGADGVMDDDLRGSDALEGDAPEELGPRPRLGHSAKVTVLRPVPSREAPVPSPPSEPVRGAQRRKPRKRTPDEPKPEKKNFGLRKTARPEAAGRADVVAFPVPRAKRIRRRAVLVGASVVAFVAGLLAVLVFTPVLAVRTITVEGTKMLTPAQVQSALAPLVGRPLPQVGPDDVSRLVLPIVQVKSVRTEAVPPNTLRVTVVERVPVALVKQGDAFSVVDGDGVEIATAKDQSAFPVPVIDPQGSHMSHETFLAVTGVLSALPPEVLGQMATASADSVDSVQLKLSTGKTVIWGNSQDRDLKAKVLQALMKNAENTPKGQAPVNVFDVSVPRHPVTR